MSDKNIEKPDYFCIIVISRTAIESSTTVLVAIKSVSQERRRKRDIERETKRDRGKERGAAGNKKKIPMRLSQSSAVLYVLSL